MSQPERLWGQLSRTEIAKPTEQHPFSLTLPPGIERAAPPKGTPPQGCTAVEGLSRLATPGRELYSCCKPTRQPPSGAFVMGCMMPLACTYVDDAGKRAATLDELPALVGPIDSAAKALGLLSLVYPEVLDPFWFEKTRGVPYDYLALPGAPAAFEIATTDTGFTVRLPLSGTCGCTHHVLRVAFHVERSGCIRRLDEPPIPLAWSHGLCVD